MNEYTVTAILERAKGNAVSGTSWLETQQFPMEASIRDVLEWATVTVLGPKPTMRDLPLATNQGRLMLSVNTTPVETCADKPADDSERGGLMEDVRDFLSHIVNRAFTEEQLPGMRAEANSLWRRWTTLDAAEREVQP